MKEEQKRDFIIHLLLQVSLLILVESLKTYQFSILNTLISFSIPVLPFIFLSTNYITKRYGNTKALLSIVITALSTLLFVLVMSFATNKTLIINDYKGDFLAYIISQVINLVIYNYLRKNTKLTYPLLFLSYIFSIVFFYMIFTLSYINTTIIDGYWKRYLISMIIIILVCIPVTIIDKKK